MENQATMTQPNTEIIVQTSHCRQVVSTLSRESVLAVDCEGIQLGVDGPLTLVQVGTYTGAVYLFDIHENKKLLTDGRLKSLLESSQIVKVMHACTSDSAALFHQFNVTLQNVFDTQVADIVIEEQNGRLLAPVLKLQTLCEKYSDGGKVSENKDELKTKWTKGQNDFWALRPLTDEMISYAAGDVRSLIPEVYEELKRMIEKNRLLETFRERVLENINITIDEEAKTKRRKRVENYTMQIIDSIIEKWEPSTKLEDLPEDGDEVRALKRIDDRDARKKSEFIDRLKTEIIQNDLKELDDELTSEGSEHIVKRYTLPFLSRTVNHPNKAMGKQAKQLKDKVQKILLNDIESKCSTETRLSHLTNSEKDVLRSLKPSSTYDDDFPEIVLRLYWILMEEDLERMYDLLADKGKDFKMKDHYYRKIKYFIARGTDVPVVLKEKARKLKRRLDSTFGRDVVPR
ncbi:piRNA biogenesis protein EXD1-like isoform X1 [Ostrea edulis]|uniref:piRNA biogenesis protein EXD1-like isoform X1 n=1 Tax=Ostrea edulis TaxID=37623 RepID=UPI0024AF6633|nr:piRNA biogenesis protein EXD1-like isoform X1 [Ostrea edulis]